MKLRCNSFLLLLIVLLLLPVHGKEGDDEEGEDEEEVVEETREKKRSRLRNDGLDVGEDRSRPLATTTTTTTRRKSKEKDDSLFVMPKTRPTDDAMGMFNDGDTKEIVVDSVAHQETDFVLVDNKRASNDDDDDDNNHDNKKKKKDGWKDRNDDVDMASLDPNDDTNDDNDAVQQSSFGTTQADKKTSTTTSTTTTTTRTARRAAPDPTTRTAATSARPDKTNKTLLDDEDDEDPGDTKERENAIQAKEITKVSKEEEDGTRRKDAADGRLAKDGSINSNSTDPTTIDGAERKATAPTNEHNDDHAKDNSTDNRNATETEIEQQDANVTTTNITTTTTANGANETAKATVQADTVDDDDDKDDEDNNKPVGRTDTDSQMKEQNQNRSTAAAPADTTNKADTDVAVPESAQSNDTDVAVDKDSAAVNDDDNQDATSHEANTTDDNDDDDYVDLDDDADQGGTNPNSTTSRNATKHNVSSFFNASITDDKDDTTTSNATESNESLGKAQDNTTIVLNYKTDENLADSTAVQGDGAIPETASANGTETTALGTKKTTDSADGLSANVTDDDQETRHGDCVRQDYCFRNGLRWGAVVDRQQQYRSANLTALHALFRDELGTVDPAATLDRLFASTTRNQRQRGTTVNDQQTSPISALLSVLNRNSTGDDESSLRNATKRHADEEPLSAPGSLAHKPSRDSDSVNAEFVYGLDDIGKFFEDVDPPDELDVGAVGTSIHEVLVGQGGRIVRKRIRMAGSFLLDAFRSVRDSIADRATPVLDYVRSSLFGMDDDDDDVMTFEPPPPHDEERRPFSSDGTYYSAPQVQRAPGYFDPERQRRRH